MGISLVKNKRGEENSRAIDHGWEDLTKEHEVPYLFRRTIKKTDAMQSYKIPHTFLILFHSSSPLCGPVHEK